MNKFLMLSAVMLLLASSTGCGCLGLFRGRQQTVAMPTAPACAPCDPCGSTYGGDVYSQPMIAQ